MHPHIHAPQAELDDAVAVSDQEAVFMAHYLMQKEGPGALFKGLTPKPVTHSSSSILTTQRDGSLSAYS